MGCCQSNEGEVRRPRENEHHNNNGPRRNNRHNYVRNERPGPAEPYWGTIDKIENIISDSYVGEGIKRTHAYTTDLTEDQYKHWKEQFWETRWEGSEDIWAVLKEACELDHKSAAKLVEQNGIVLQNNRLTFWYDSMGRSYVIPAACINEPVGFGVDKEKEMLDAKDQPDEVKTLNLVLRNASTFNDDKIEIDDDCSVLELKKKYAELKNCDDHKMVRILYFGKELKDDYNLYHYQINDEVILIGVINELLYED